MNAKATAHLEFAPPPLSGAGKAWLTACLVHALLFMALGLATAWKNQPQTVQVQAELWAVTPQTQAPQLHDPLPESEPPVQPDPLPTASPAPMPLKVEPQRELRDAQIAIEKKKETEKIEQLKAEKEKAELKHKKREKEKLAKEKKTEEKATLAKADALRTENLKRMQGMASASASDNAAGSALKSAAPSASYGGRLVGRIKPNITYPGDVAGNPRAEVEVKVAPDGTILSSRIIQTSRNKAWDDAVLRAIEKTGILPRDTDGRIPPVIVLGFKPQD